MNTRSVEQKEPSSGTARSHEAGAGTVSRPIAGLNVGSTPAPRSFVEVGLAFPSQHHTAQGEPCSPADGLTKREYIATMALQGILAHSYNDASYEGAARDAVVHADHLLQELAK
jgi:hypothetical protein